MMKHAPASPHRSRRILAALVAVTLAVGLAGCFASGGGSGGQTAAAAMRQVKAIPGSAASTYVASDSSYSGFTKVISTTVNLDIAPDHVIPDPGALIDYLIRVAWSVNDAKPNGDLLVTIDSAVAVDATAAAKAAGWATAHSLSNAPTSVFVKLSEAKKRLGDWPGKVPTAPDGVIVAGTPSP